MNKVRVGIIGVGKAGLLFGKAVRASRNGELVALAAQTQEEAHSVGGLLGCANNTGNWHDLVNDDAVQAVFICSPTHLHAQMTIAAARAGKHVLCDKPMCLSSQDADDMTAACTHAGVLLMVGFIERFNPAFRVIKDAIAQGKIGDPVMVSCRRAHPPRKGSWIMDDAKSGGAFLHTGCHNIDLVQWLFESPVAEVSAQQKQSGISLGFTDISAVIGKLRNGVLLSMVESYAHPTTMPMGVDRSFEILGTAGSLYLDLLRSPVTLCNDQGWQYQDVLTWVETDGQLSGALTSETEYFLQCVQQGCQPAQAQAADGKRTILVYEAAKRAAAEGRRITLDL